MIKTWIITTLFFDILLFINTDVYSQVVLIQFIENDVRIDAYGKEDQALGEISFNDKTPDDNPTVTYETIVDLKVRCIRKVGLYTEEERITWPWRYDDFNAISFWVKGYKGGWIEFDLYEEGIASPYKYKFYLENNWQYKEVLLSEFVNAEIPGQTINIANIRFFQLLSRLKTKVSFGGGITLEAKLDLPPQNYGNIIINPQPKQIQIAAGFLTLRHHNIYILKTASERSCKTAIYLAEELYGRFGIRFGVIKISKLPTNRGIVMSVNTGLSVDMTDGGYTVAVNNKSVCLKGIDEAGLYYAANTLIQVIKGPIKITKYPSIPKVYIRDWPDLKHRVCHINLAWWRRKPDMQSLDWFKDYIKTSIAGQKINMMVFESVDGFVFEHNPKLQINKNPADLIWDKIKQQEMAGFCREHFIEFVPHIRSASNIHWIPRTQYPHFYVNTASTKGDPTAEGYYDVLLACIDELIEDTGCNYFHIEHDEWWTGLSGYTDNIFKRWTDAAGVEHTITAREAFLNDVEILYAHLKSKNIKTMMYADMLLQRHNGDGDGLFKDHYTIISQLPKDIIMMNWSNPVDTASNQILYDHGFEVMCVANGFRACVPDKFMLSGFGNLAYGASHMMSGLVNDKHCREFGYTTLLRSADYAWNIGNDPGTPLDEFENTRMENISAIQSIHPNPYADTQCSPVSLANATNTNLCTATGIELEQYPLGTQSFGFIPTELLSPEADSSIIVPSEEVAIEIDVSRKASSLYFVHAFYTLPENRPALFRRGNQYLFGPPMITYTMIYNDETSQTQNANFGYNILDIVPAILNTRFMSQVRYVWMGHTTKGKIACLYQQEWVNPFPHKTINTISIVSRCPESTPLVFAITARDSKSHCRR